jgi:hypothetical protein
MAARNHRCPVGSADVVRNALSHGLVYLPPTTPQPSAPTSAIHAPLSIFPSPLPRRLFDHARKLQKIYNVLYARIAMDEEFLDRVMGEGVAKADEFVGTMWRGWRNLRDEGLVQVRRLFHLGFKGPLTYVELIAASIRHIPLGLFAACAVGRRPLVIETS